jgi:hypothetical protein
MVSFSLSKEERWRQMVVVDMWWWGGRMDNRIECRAKRDFWEKVLHFRKKVFCLEAYIYFWMLSTALETR